MDDSEKPAVDLPAIIAADLPSSEDIAALLTGLAVSTLQKMRVHGNGPPHCKVGRRVLYRPSVCRAWMQAREVNSTSERVTA